MSVAAPSATATASRTGEEIFRKLAADGAQTPWDSVGDLAPGLGAHIQHGLSALVGDDGLDLRTRELATICMLAALGDCGPQLAFHTAGALRAGATRAEVVQAIAQVALYAGIPRTLNALAIARPVIEAA